MTPLPLSSLLRAGTPLTALIAKMPCAAQVESAGHTGFDLIVIDTEHGPAGGHELEHHLRAAAAAGLPALVRVPSADASAILAALDAGAAGVVVPHVLDGEGAEAVVASAHYPPRGRRGLATSTRAGGYGAVGLEEHLRRAGEETCVVVQIEDAQAVPHADEILSVPGVSAVLIGAADLSISLGRPGEPSHRDVEAAITRIYAASARAGVPAMAVAGSAAEAVAARTRGASVVAWVATALIHRAFVQAVRDTGPDPVSAGDREPLVLLPGMLGTAALWDDVAPVLADRGLPQSARIDLDESVGEMAESVLAAAPRRFALAGHSLGAIVALEVARRAPGRVTRLALLNGSGRPATGAQLEAWDALRELTESGAFADVARDFASANLPPARRDDGALIDRVEAMALSVGPRGFLRQLAAQSNRPDLRPTLAAVAVPTLVVTGAEDDVCPAELQAELVAGIPGAEHVTLEHVGHLAPLEAPAIVGERLLAWLAR